MAAEVEVPAAGGGDSMAARLARQRQQRSMLRTSNLPLEDASDATAGSGSELQILRAEVASSSRTISRLETQLKQSDAETQQLGSQTARMAEELRLMQERAKGAQLAMEAMAPAPTAAAEGDMQVSISMPVDSTNPMDGISVHISIGTARNGEALVTVE